MGRRPSSYWIYFARIILDTVEVERLSSFAISLPERGSGSIEVFVKNLICFSQISVPILDTFLFLVSTAFMNHLAS